MCIYTPIGVDLGKLNLEFELDRFFRSVKLSLFFSEPSDTPGTDAAGSNNDTVHFSHPDMKKASTWTLPPVSHLDHVISMIQNDIISFKLANTHNHNLTSAQYTAIKSLSSNKDIVIKPADTMSTHTI